MKIILIIFSACFAIELSAQRIYERARVYLDENQLKKAAVLLDSCFDRSYFPDSALYYKSIVFLKDLKPGKASKLAERLEHEYPDFKEVHYVSGMIYFTNKDYGKAIEQFNLSLKFYPNHVKALYNRALAEALLEDYDAAIEDLGHAIEITPSNPDLYYSRAYWRNIAGKSDDAIIDFNKTVELDPKNLDAYLGLAQIYQAQKNLAKACESVERAAAAGSQIATELKTQYCGDH